MTSSSNTLDDASRTDPSVEQRRACDRCRRIKRRCEGGQTCKQCAGQNLLCTYQDQVAKIRTVADLQRHSRAHIEALENRLRNAEQALRKPGQHLVSSALRGLVQNAPHPDDPSPDDIAASFQALSLDGHSPDPGFQGESSSGMMVKMAVEAKSGRPSMSERKTPAPKPWRMKPWDDHLIRPPLSFPDDEQLTSLVSLYFSNVNIFLPVLQRRIFEDHVSQGLHRLQYDFACTLLLVCALGSLYLTQSSLSEHDRLTLAWEYYVQVELCGEFLRQQPTTHDLQAYCLAAIFLNCVDSPRSSWLIVGFGLQFVQDIGSHRRAPMIRTEEELEKRATWVLVLLDVQLGAALGRNTTMNPFDLHIGPPCECDDEYWGPESPGVQPAQAPSSMAFFSCMVRLYRIFHFLLKNLYSTSRFYTATGIDDLRPIVAELEITLKKWFNSIPPYLTWDPDRREALFFDQSAALHCFYQYTCMLIHRPFIPASRLKQPVNQSASVSLPELNALHACTNAARACLNVADIHRRRRPDTPLFFSQEPLFTAAMVFILDRWARPQRTDDGSRNLTEIHTVVDILRSQQPRWPSSGFLVTVLERLLYLDRTPDDPSTDTASEAPESWVALAQAWFKAGSSAQAYQTPRAFEIPPALAGDHDVPVTRHRQLRADFAMDL
ncbi:fungal-specific transcription factor domain-containing protein [Mycena polygramma]|nr:fungal-specific transcription factor domain-containing protein [Mycena polygramma]